MNFKCLVCDKKFPVEKVVRGDRGLYCSHECKIKMEPNK